MKKKVFREKNEKKDEMEILVEDMLEEIKTKPKGKKKKDD